MTVPPKKPAASCSARHPESSPTTDWSPHVCKHPHQKHAGRPTSRAGRTTAQAVWGRKARSREALAGILFVLPTLVIFGLFKFLPIFGAGAMSLTEYSLNGDFEFLGADNYTRLAADPTLLAEPRVTFLYVAIFVPFIIAVSLAGAVLLDKLVRFTGLFRALLFIPYLSSFVMAGIIWTWIFSTDGPLNAASVGLGWAPCPSSPDPNCWCCCPWPWCPSGKASATPC